MNSEIEEVKPVSWFVDGIEKARDYQSLIGWIVRKVVPHKSIIGVVGESGSGKSNFVYDILMYYLCGHEEWHEKRSMKGDDRNCVLLSSEGVPEKRLKGWLIKHGYPEPKGKLLLLDPTKVEGGIQIDEKKADELIEQIQEITPTVGLIVIDTLNGFYKGDESSNSDMGIFMNGINKISKSLNSTVILIHHKGKNTADPTGRGASAFNARLDINIEVTGKPLSEVGSRVKITKSRDDEEGFSFNVKSERVEIAKDEEGEPITTIVVSEVSETKTADETAKEDGDFLLIQEGISEGFLKVDNEGFITRGNIKDFLKSRRPEDERDSTTFDNQTRATNESGLCGRLVKKGCLEWNKDKKSYRLIESSSYHWET